VVSRIIEGIAEATAAIAKVFSCVASDYFRKRKVFGRARLRTGRHHQARIEGVRVIGISG